MLPYALAIVVGISSSILFVSAFLFKDLHRQDDFLWSGVGLFYALTLWFGSNNIRGSLLLGQLAAVCLLTAYFWQVWNLRTAIAKPEQNIPEERFSVVEFTRNLFKRKSSGKNSPPEKTKKAETKSTTKATKTPQSAKPVATPSAKTVSNQNIAPTKNNSAEAPKSQTPKTEQSPTIKQQTSTNSNVVSNTKAQEEVRNSKEPADNLATSPTEASKPEPNNPEENKSETSQTDVVATSPQIQEIQAEEITVIEEESNWDDEVEDIDPQSVTVIEVEAEQSEGEEEQKNPNEQNR